MPFLGDKPIQSERSNPLLPLHKQGVIISCILACCVHVNLASEGLEYLVEEALAELVHGTLQLAALALPLLVVAHGLGRGPLPCGGSGVVVHVVVPAPLVHPLLPAGGGTERGVVTTTSLLRTSRVGGCIKKLRC